MSLEIGESAWSITIEGGAGVAILWTGESVSVILVGVADCRPYAAFEAPPGSSHVIRFHDDGSVDVEDITGGATEMGPGMGERTPTGCEVFLSP